jgi:PAS domain S-box-containing protein
MQGSESKGLPGPLLPSFAKFILDHHLEEYVREGIRMTFEVDLPIMKFFKGMSDEQLYDLSMAGTRDVLLSIIEGTSDAFLQRSLELWKNNQLPLMEKEDIVTEDITLLTHLRKKMMVTFIPRFTTDLAKAIELVVEIDRWQLEYESQSFKTFIQLLQDRIDKQLDKLKQSEADFKQAQSVTHIGSYVWELEPEKLTWSDELYRIYGLDPSTTTVTNELAASFNYDASADQIFESIGKSKETLKPFDFHYRIVLPGGTMKILHARGEIVVDHENKPTKIFGTAQDVTAQKETERKLEQNMIFINKIADAAPAIIASYNIQTGELAYVSKGLQKMLGYNPDHAREAGLPFFSEIVHPDDLPRILQQNQQSQQLANENGHDPNEPVVEFQYRMRNANGAYQWFHTFGTVFSRDALGQVELVLNISLDITEKVKAEEILLRRTTELQQSNANLQEFAFVASHDLKEPLRKISTLGDRLLQTERNNYTANGKIYLDKMITGAIRMQQMVDDLLALSQISSINHFEPTDLDQLLHEVLQTFESRIESLHATIKANKLPTASVVPSQFRQLFQNLISNSLKFTRKDVLPVLNISCDWPSENELRNLNLRSATSYARITFADNGIGFDNRFSEKIFAIFQRLHTKAEYDGTGIGLAICRKVMENHGGLLQASGRPGEGSEFSIIIPVD